MNRLVAFYRRAELATNARHQLHTLHLEQPPVPAAPDPQSPAGKRLLRGIPVIANTGGLDNRRNPLHVILDREHQREQARRRDQ